MARIADVKRVQMSAEVQTNFIPEVLGCMEIRAGTGFLGSTASDKTAKFLPFVKRTDDTALLEFTDSVMRVWDEDAVLQRPMVSTVTRGGDFSADITNWNKIADPASLPASTGNQVAFSADGQFMAVAHATTPFVTIYQIAGGIFTKLADPATLPAAAGTGCAFSPDGLYLAITHSTSPFVTIYSISGATFTKIANPASLPAGNGRAVAFSSNSQLMAVAHSTSPFVTIYSIAAGIFTKLANPSTLPAGAGNGVSFSRDGVFLCVGHATTPFITIYEIIGGTTFSKIPDPSSLPPDANGVAFSYGSQYLAVAHGTTPFFNLYSISGNTFTKLADPATPLDGIGTTPAFSTDDQFLVFSHNTGQRLTIYDLATGGPVKIADPATVPTGTGNGAAFSSDNHWMAIAHATTPFVTIYEAYQWLDRDQAGTSSVYASSSSTITAGPITLGANPTNWANYTIRNVFSAGAFGISATRIVVRFGGDGSGTFTCSKAYIAEKASSGDSYDYAGAPTPLTFSGGAPGFTITNSQTIDTDEINFVLDRNKGYVITFVSPSSATDDFGMSSGNANCDLYYKPGDDAATVNATGYTNYSATRDVGGVVQVSAVTTGTSGYLNMVGTNYAVARRIQTLQIANADLNKLHALRIIIAQGVVVVRIGTEEGLDDVLLETTLVEGVHSITFTPTTNLIFLEVESGTLYTTLLDSVTIESGSAAFEENSPYTLADLPYLRWDQSGDVVFIAAKDRQPYKVERRAGNSWSIVKYQPEDGPFRSLNTGKITMTPSALTGDITIAASRAYFKSTMAGAIFRITSIGQVIQATLTGENQFTAGSIKVTGVGDTRKFSVIRTGTFSATITLQRSLSAPGAWVDVTTYTTAATITYDDGLDNQVAYYRIGIKTGNYTSGSAAVSLSYSSGSLKGVARITAVTSPTLVQAIVLKDFGALTASENWEEGLWSDYRGWPSAVTIYEGRLWQAGKDQLEGSVSDAFASFDSEVEGDSGPINRSIGSGPVDVINWLLPLSRLIAGGQSAERSARSSSFDEALTNANINLKDSSNNGTSAVKPEKFDTSGVFAQRSRRRLIQLAYDSSSYDYSAVNLSQLIPEALASQIVTLGIQREPDTRIHCVLGNGTVALLVLDRVETVTAWVDVTTNGLIGDVVVLPGLEGDNEDRVYYVVARTVGGATKRYLERFAFQEDCRGGTVSKLGDAHILFTNGPASAIVTGLGHLEGLAVVAWADGKAMMNVDGNNPQTFTVTGGQISLTNRNVAYVATTGCVGLPYTAQFKSAKITTAVGFNRKQKLDQLGLMLADTHHRGLKFAGDFDHLDNMPKVENGKTVALDTIWDQYDFDLMPINDKFSTDSRLCLQAQAPLPCTVKAASLVTTSGGG